MVMHNKMKRNWQNYVVAYSMEIPGVRSGIEERHDDPQSSRDPGQVSNRVHSEYKFANLVGTAEVCIVAFRILNKS